MKEWLKQAVGKLFGATIMTQRRTALVLAIESYDRDATDEDIVGRADEFYRFMRKGA